MEQQIQDMIPQNFAVLWIAMLVLLIVVLIKVLPKLWKSFNNIRIHVNELENLTNTVKENSEAIKQIESKMGRDFVRLNSLEKVTMEQQRYNDESLEERELVLKSLLGIIQGLQEIGANGPTKVAEADIQAFLIKKSHKHQDRDNI